MTTPPKHAKLGFASTWLERERARLRAEALATENPGPPVPGEHCRYCKAAGRCPATNNVLQAGLGAAAGTVNLLDVPTDELLALYAARSAFKTFWEDVETRVETLALMGHERITIKETQGRQMWADPQDATLTLLALGRTDLVQPVALTSALPALPAEMRATLVKRSAPSRSIQIANAPVVKEVAMMFKKYAKGQP